MNTPWDALVGEINVLAPAFALEQAEEVVGVAKVFCALGHAHVEPDAEIWPGEWSFYKAEDAAVVPPDRRGENGDFAENLRVFKAKEERDKTAEGGAADGGSGRAGLGAVDAIDLRFELFDEEAGVTPGFATAELEVAGGGVFGHAAEAGVGDADENDWLNFARFSEAVGGGVGAPGVAGNVGGEVVEEVLTVVEIEDGEAAVGIGEVGFWQINGDAAFEGIGEDGGVEAEPFKSRNVGDACLGDGGGFGAFGFLRRWFFRGEKAGIGWDAGCRRNVANSEQAAWRFGFR